MLPREWKCIVVYRIGERHKTIVVRGPSKTHIDKTIEEIKQAFANQSRVPVVVVQKFYN
jgi:hypothetical protein